MIPGQTIRFTRGKAKAGRKPLWYVAVLRIPSLEREGTLYSF